jgi:hypothetical protein
MAPHIALGISMSVLKSAYKARTVARGKKRTATAYATCFLWILDKILRDVRLGRISHADGLAFILECGNEHNSEVEEQFYKVRELHNLQGVLRSIRAVPKDSCRAIQIADLLAFYSRRRGVSSLEKGQRSK